MAILYLQTVLTVACRWFSASGRMLTAGIRGLAAMVLFPLLLSACPGPDYTPVYFQMKPADSGAGKPAEAKPDENLSTGNCTVNFTSSLCVSIYGDSVKVGVEGSEPLCADIDPIPIEVSGDNLILRGNTFPVIPFEGHGLPAPIKIDGKGASDGTDNIGKGKIDPSGNIFIEGFSFYINALGMVGELPGLSFTSGRTEQLDGLPVIEGTPLGSDGKLKLVVGTKIGHLFPAADEKLYGASLQAVFEGTVKPLLSECKGGDSKPQATFVTKIVVDEDGRQTEAMLPGYTRMEIGGVFISEGPQDIGPNFESSAKFRIINASAKDISVDIPPVIGAFSIEALQGELKQNLPPKTPLVVKVTFRPTSDNVKQEGEVNEAVMIGPDVYQLVGEALKQSGKPMFSADDGNGNFMQVDDAVKLGEVMVSTVGRREFFSCRKIICDGSEKLTGCVPCVDVLLNVCQLLPVDRNGNPTDTVDSNCRPTNQNSRDSFSIGLGNGVSGPVKRTVEIKNSGVKPLRIDSIAIEEIPGSRSTGQFKISSGLILPVILQPYDISKETLNLTVVYEPNDLVGFDGTDASVGHPVRDRSMLRVNAGDRSRHLELSGITSVKEVPALQVYLKSPAGTKELLDGGEFAFRGITDKTENMAVPLFIKLSDSAMKAIRITKFTLSPGSAFEWLDTKEKIDSKPEGSRCAIPVFDPSGGMSGRITDLNPVSLLPNGFDLKPGAYTTDNMPLFGCVNFVLGAEKKRQYKAVLSIYTQELDRNGQPVRNSDGSLKQTSFNINLLAVLNPLKGKMVFRITQTMAAIMNPQFPSVSASSSKKELEVQIAEGIARQSDVTVLPGAMILDPFDEETITDEKGNILSSPGDGITAIYRKIDTHPVSDLYDQPLLPDYTSLVYDASAPEGERGIFFDYPNIPGGFRSPGLRMYTATLSYPGPLATPEQRPESVSMCQEVNPCSEEGQRMMGEGPSDKSKKGVCAFFYGTVGSWNGSPSLRNPGEIEGAERQDLCKVVDRPQKLQDVSGVYNLNGGIDFLDVGLRLWGPTYFNNPSGPLGPVAPLDAIFHVNFTTGVLTPDKIPDKRVNTAKQEHKINLTDTKLETPRLCDTSVRNRMLGGERYSTWRYLAPLLVKDEEGTTPAGCPEPGENFTGGSAFLRGRPLDQETGQATFVASAKFASEDNLTFAFKDVMFFIVLNGWMCDPNGSEENFEGAKCYDIVFNERDGRTTISIIK